MDKLLFEFENLLNQMDGKGLGGSIDILLLQMDEEKAEQLKLCAIPHQFDSDILQVLNPKLDDTQAQKLYEEFINLSIILSHKNGATIHDEARLYLFKQWLLPISASKFQQANERLTQYYEKLNVNIQGIAKEDLERDYMFHLIGVNQTDGFAEFRRLFRERWHQYRISECETMIYMVHEYDTILSSQNALWLMYYEGNLAAGSRQWSYAKRFFTKIISHKNLTPKLQVKAYYRLGIVHACQREWANAIEVFNNALKVMESSGVYAEFVDEVMHEIGIVYRDSGELNQAVKFLTEGLRIATEQNDFASMAMAYNSLGSLQQKLGKPHEAIHMYEESLSILIENKDRFRPAQVYNNLGMAYADQREWQKSEEFLLKSLEIKRQAGDTHGQAMTLSNLSRVYSNHQLPERVTEVSYQAINLFNEVKDYYNTALVTRNLAKLHRSMNNTTLAIDTFKEAAELFNKCNEYKEAEITQIELDALGKGGEGIPPWVKATIVAFLSLVFLIFAIALFK